jgi:hypothetical protein
MKTMKKVNVAKGSVKSKPKAKMGMVTKKTPVAKKGIIKKAEMGMVTESSGGPKRPKRPKRKGFGKGAVPKFKVKMRKGKVCTSKGCN